LVTKDAMPAAMCMKTCVHLQCAAAAVLVAACMVHVQVVAELMEPRGGVLRTT
jgi:hypothetical protein